MYSHNPRPFGCSEFLSLLEGKLEAKNRLGPTYGYGSLVMLLESKLYPLFSTEPPTKPFHMAFGVLILKEQLNCRHEEFLEQIIVNPYLQYLQETLNIFIKNNFGIW